MSLLPSLVQLTQKKGIPARTTIELLAPCNLKCPHCFVDHSKRSALTLDVLETLFSELADLGVFALTFTGGEIGLRPDLFDIIAAAKARHFAVGLLSTGTLWQEREWNSLASLGVSFVRLSLYGASGDIHDQVTLTRGSHAKTLRSAAALHARGIETAFACTVTQHNVHDVGNTIELANRMGIDINIDSQISLGIETTKQPKSTEANLDALIAMYSDIRVSNLQSPDEACSSVAKGRPCGVGELTAFIDARGDVYPCVNWPKSGGNITRQRFSKIWRDSAPFVTARGVGYDTFKPCGSCGDAPRCSPCAAMNLSDNGDLAIPSESVCLSTAARTIGVTGQSSQPARLSSRSGLPILRR